MVYSMNACKGCAARREYLKQKANQVKQYVSKKVAPKTKVKDKNGA